ncbi:MAG: Mth938-like domain-containing protein [Sphingomonas sp.]|uniref:Mth938-like domain-containing protein n=1 Tax=Sphingomonas sp. TaxID=28214 RepID=UPI0025F23F9A|nr:Mth938-like domain-containing protein [Sphingomonas sp.]MBY0283964.1 Mth938-like domain-containing protein [Sphingomonas sp.]
MKLAREGSGDGPLIQGFALGGFRIDDNIYTALLITPQRADGWTPPPVEALDEATLAPLLALDPLPEFVLLGTGAGLILPPRALVAALEARGIGIEPMDSRAAARAWSVLRGEGRWIAGALYPL